MTDIFFKLKKLRESLGLKQSDVAACTDMSQRDISLLENGRKEFIPTSYIVFYTQIGIDVRWIFNGRPYEEDVAYLREFVKKLSMRNLSGIDLVNLYKRKVEEGAPDQVSQTIVPLSEVYVIRAESGREYAANYRKPAYLDRQDRIQLPMAEAYRETYRCFQTEGDRMAPAIMPGDYLIGHLIEPGEFTEFEGSVFIVVTKDIQTGRLSRTTDDGYTLSYHNQQYPARKLDRREIKELWVAKWRLTPQVSGAPEAFLSDLQRRLEDLEARLGR